jgi:hypothetical protein
MYTASALDSFSQVNGAFKQVENCRQAALELKHGNHGKGPVEQRSVAASSSSCWPFHAQTIVKGLETLQCHPCGIDANMSLCLYPGCPL